jgi:rubrerythrin
MAATRLDLTRLSLRDALDLAVLVEEEARDRYEELTHQLELHHTPEAARFFRFMVANEERHRTALAERRARLFAGQPCTVRLEMIFDVEAPAYDEARAYMTLRQALAAALRSEKKAGQFFAQAVEQVTDADVRGLFSELAKEEIEHQRLVEVEIAKLPADDPYRQEDFEDEPVVQD